MTNVTNLIRIETKSKQRNKHHIHNRTVFLKQGWFAPQGDICLCPKTFWGKSYQYLVEKEARNAAKYPTKHRLTLKAKNYLAPRSIRSRLKNANIEKANDGESGMNLVISVSGWGNMNTVLIIVLNLVFSYNLEINSK